jgi:hypothetical protein
MAVESLPPGFLLQKDYEERPAGGGVVLIRRVKSR